VLQQRLIELLNRVEELEAHLIANKDEHERQLTCIRADHAQLVQSFVTNLVDAEENASQLDSELTSTKAQLKAFQFDKEADIVILQEKIQSLESAMSTAHAVTLQLETKTVDFQAAQRDASVVWQRSIEESQSKHREHFEKLQITSAQHSELAVLHQNAALENTRLREQLLLAESSFREQQAKLTDLLTVHQRLSAENTRLREQVAMADASLNQMLNLSSKLQFQSTQQDALSELHNILAEENIRLRAQLSTNAVSLATLHSDFECLQVNNASLRTQIANLIFQVGTRTDQSTQPPVLQTANSLPPASMTADLEDRALSPLNQNDSATVTELRMQVAQLERQIKELLATPPIVSTRELVAVPAQEATSLLTPAGPPEVWLRSSSLIDEIGSSASINVHLHASKNGAIISPKSTWIPVRSRMSIGAPTGTPDRSRTNSNAQSSIQSTRTGEESASLRELRLNTSSPMISVAPKEEPGLFQRLLPPALAAMFFAAAKSEPAPPEATRPSPAPTPVALLAPARSQSIRPFLGLSSITSGGAISVVSDVGVRGAADASEVLSRVREDAMPSSPVSSIPPAKNPQSRSLFLPRRM
jgi:hypothetical protein